MCRIRKVFRVERLYVGGLYCYNLRNVIIFFRAMCHIATIGGKMMEVKFMRGITKDEVSKFVLREGQSVQFCTFDEVIDMREEAILTLSEYAKLFEKADNKRDKMEYLQGIIETAQEAAALIDSVYKMREILEHEAKKNRVLALDYAKSSKSLHEAEKRCKQRAIEYGWKADRYRKKCNELDDRRECVEASIEMVYRDNNRVKEMSKVYRETYKELRLLDLEKMTLEAGQLESPLLAHNNAFEKQVEENMPTMEMLDYYFDITGRDATFNRELQTGKVKTYKIIDKINNKIPTIEEDTKEAVTERLLDRREYFDFLTNKKEDELLKIDTCCGLLTEEETAEVLGQMVDDLCGDKTRLATILGYPRTTVNRWLKTGSVPVKKRAEVLKSAFLAGVGFGLPDRVFNIVRDSNSELYYKWFPIDRRVKKTLDEDDDDYY